jgi:dTDP-glucose 4,6-dehydratase
MKILVTGGLGFIGSHFARTALKKGHEVSVLDKLTYAGHRENLTDIATELEDLQILDIASEETTRYLSRRKFDLVVNFAAESHVDRSIRGGLDFVASNVAGVVNLLESQKKGSFEKFIQISTDEVYGSIPEGSWDEKAPLQPRSPYSCLLYTSDAADE